LQQKGSDKYLWCNLTAVKQYNNKTGFAIHTMSSLFLDKTE